LFDWGKVPGLREELKEVERCIESTLKSRQKLLTQTIQELNAAGGKRLRPALVLLSGKFGRTGSDKLIPLAAIIEILHMATLVHDDIIDDAPLRRGKPTLQSRWGKDVAVFTGDYLFSKAFFLLTENVSFDYLQKVAMAIRKICEGEIDQYQSRYDLDVTLKKYLKRIAYKTAVLFALSCQIGAQESGCSEKETRALRHFGMNLGMAFQIVDDILDVQGYEKVVGKPVGSDFINGIYTLPLLYALQKEQTGQELREILVRANKAGHVFSKEDVSRVLELIHVSGGVEYSQRIVKRYHDKALNDIRCLPDIPARSMMIELVKQLAGREY